jgi:hypothetical protein
MVAGARALSIATAAREVEAAVDGLGHEERVHVLVGALAAMDRGGVDPRAMGAMLAAAVQQRRARRACE